jgi:hypothetical protein
MREIVLETSSVKPYKSPTAPPSFPWITINIKMHITIVRINESKPISPESTYVITKPTNDEAIMGLAFRLALIVNCQPNPLYGGSLPTNADRQQDDLEIISAMNSDRHILLVRPISAEIARITSNTTAAMAAEPL